MVQANERNRIDYPHYFLVIICMYTIFIVLLVCYNLQLLMVVALRDVLHIHPFFL